MGYRFQFVTWRASTRSTSACFNLARDYKSLGMEAYSQLQEAESAAETVGYTATRHQREVGTGYFDQVRQVIIGGAAATQAMADSTEAAQFTG